MGLTGVLAVYVALVVWSVLLVVCWRRGAFGHAPRNRAGGRRAATAPHRRVAADLDRTMTFYEHASVDGGFEAGMEAALTSMLVSPKFLFRVETDPADAQPGVPYALTDHELASRLSFFPKDVLTALWTTITHRCPSHNRNRIYAKKFLPPQ